MTIVSEELQAEIKRLKSMARDVGYGDYFGRDYLQKRFDEQRDRVLEELGHTEGVTGTLLSDRHPEEQVRSIEAIATMAGVTSCGGLPTNVISATR